MLRIPCPISENSSKTPEAPAFKTPGYVVTYDQLEQQVRFLVKKIQSLKVKEGSRVAIVSDNSPLTVALMFALYRIKATALFLSLQLTPEDWDQQLKMANVSVVFGQNKYLTKFKNKLEHTFSYSEVLTEFQSSYRIESAEPKDLYLDSDASIIFTSSVTGHKKGVVCTISNFVSSATASNKITKITSGDWWGVSLPLYHMGGLGIIFRTLFSGAGSNFLADFSPKTLLSEISNRNLTHLSLVPTVLEALIDEAVSKGDEGIKTLKSMKATVLAGAASSSILIDKILKYDLPILSAWGMTETTAHCTCMSLDDPREKVTTVGKPFYNTKLKLIDENGTEVTDGQGEILVNGPTVCKSYFDPDMPQPKIIDGWLYTGDLGTFDSEGYLKIVGRIDDMFISGGENIHAGEIEDVVKKYDKIKDAAIIPVAHPKWGHRPLLIVETKSNEKVDLAEIKKFLENKIAKIKIPDELIQLDQLPRTGIGKIDYKELKRLYSKA